MDGLKQQILKLQELSNNILLPSSTSNDYSNNKSSQEGSSFSPLAVSSASSSSPSSRLQKYSQQQTGQQQQQQQQQQQTPRFNSDPLHSTPMQGVISHNNSNLGIPQSQQIGIQQHPEPLHSQTRLPSISMFDTNLSSSNTTSTTSTSTTTATPLRPLVGYGGSSHIGPPDKSKDKSASTSPMLDGFSRRTSSEHYPTIRRASDEQMSPYKREGTNMITL